VSPYADAMASIAANGITIEYDERGEGEPLLLVMGLGGQLTDWPEEFVDLLAVQGFHVIRFDNRDAGLSTEFDWEPPSIARAAAMMATRRRPRAGYLLRDMADDAAGLLDALHIPSAHVVGISMGGMIAQTMAIHHPDKVRSLTSIMSNTGDRRRGRVHPRLLAKMARLPRPTPQNALERASTVFRWVSGPGFDADAHRRLAAANIERSFRPLGTARQMTAIMASPDRTADLMRVTAPTLVIHGLLDPLVRPSGGHATANAIPGSRLVMYPDMGHDLPRTRWPEIVDAIARNARRASAPEPAAGTR
jgi:pimeloyl-ACP methyl ester carboxylesterase